MAMDPQSRKWQITANNPEKHGLTHDVIQEIMSSVRGKSLYWCMCDEIGDECETLHTHIFIYRKAPFYASQINNLFPNMHREKAYGSCLENRAYVLKDGDKFNKDETGHYSYIDKKHKTHEGINYSDTFYEFGDCPADGSGDSASDTVVDMIRSGATDEQIVESVPSTYRELEHVQRVRSMFRDSAFSDSWRDLTVTYIFGSTGTGKTRSVMEQYGYKNCYRVTDYKHPFDSYNGEDVMIFEEFRSGLKHGDMLNYLDGYPVKLPCRYFDRQACFTKVFIISNIPLEAQFPNIDRESKDAFYRRIQTVKEFTPVGVVVWDSVPAYLASIGQTIS